MSKAIVNFDSAKVPAHLQEMFGGVATSDLSAGVGSGFPILSIKGKVWKVVRGKDGGEVIMNEDGDPRSSIEVVIIKANPNLSKVFYAKGYVEGSDAKPDCYSNDGLAPGADAVAPQSSKCAICPKNQWGSRITENGGKGKACSDSRRVAIAPLGQLNDPMLLRVPPASLKPLAEYGQMFAKKGVPYQAVATKLSFVAESASPTLAFKYIEFLTPEQIAQVKEVMDSDVVAQIIGVTDSGFTAEPATAPAITAPKMAKAPVDDEVPAPTPAAKAKPVAKAPVVKDADDLASALDAVLGESDDE